MTTLTIAAAQSISIAGDLPTNISSHLRLMELAAGHGVQLLVFPELSLTGYELKLGRELALRPDSTLLAPLREYAQRTGMTTVVGAPVQLGDAGEVFIGALALDAEGGMSCYAKQHLHSGEEAYFSAGKCGAALTVGGMKTALAICADILQPSHALQAAQAAATLYAAGVLISQRAYVDEAALLRTYAVEHDMAVLMANHGGETGGWSPAGRSALWAAGGELIAAAPGDGELLVTATLEAGRWSGRVINPSA